MAFALITSLQNTIEFHFLQPIPCLIVDDDDKEMIESLCKKIQTLQAFLEDSEKNNINIKARRVLETKIRDVAQDAEEKIDSKLHQLCLCCNEVEHPVKLPESLYQILQQVNEDETASQEHNLREMLLQLLCCIKTMTDETDDGGDDEEDSMESKIRKKLKGRRYLIVMDDIWSTKAWDDIHRCFPNEDFNGSRILLTTRLKQVAAYVSSSNNLHSMRFLNPDESWNLFYKKVFEGNNHVNMFGFKSLRPLD